MTYLRYPVSWWWLGIYQGFNRIVWSIKNKRLAGIFAGIILIPQLILKYQGDRHPIAAKSLKKYLKHRREFINVELP